MEVERQFAMAGVVVVETRVGWVKAGKPAGWEEEVDGVKQACWCGEMWDDNHEDGNHEAVWVKEAAVGSGLGSGLGKRAAEAGAGAEAKKTKKAKKAKMTKKEKTAKAKAAAAARAARDAESDSEPREGWQKGWYGPVPSEE